MRSVIMATFIIKPGEWASAVRMVAPGNSPGVRQYGQILLQDIELKAKINAAELMGDIPTWEMLMAKWERWQRDGIPASRPGPRDYP